MKTILIVDDNKYLRDMLAPVLGDAVRSRHRILQAANGMDAVDILATTAIDLIITDICMPVMDGFGLIEYRNRCHPATPLIAMTGDANPKVMERLRSFGVAECLEKPFRLDAVVRMVENKLGSTKRSEKRALAVAAAG